MKGMLDEVEEEEISVMDAFDIVWHKFVIWACLQGDLYLPKETAQLLQSSIRQPTMLALITANNMLQRVKEGEPGWEEVENRRKIIKDRSWEPVENRAKELLLLQEVKLPDEVKTKLFDYANVILDLIDEMNEA